MFVALPLTARAASTPSGAPKVVSRADRLDALDFDNGTILLSETGSYGSGIGAWSAWHLTDGDEEVGWCSSQGSPIGATFVWDLDTVWDLEAFAVSTRNMQEGVEYPGISAKSVDLWLGEGGSWRKAGTFRSGSSSARSTRCRPAAARSR